jgi:predicted dehydrogenase
MARQAAEAGKHCFVEKPLATSLEEAVAAVTASQNANVQLSVNYVLRHHPLHTMAAAIIRSGALGPLGHFSLENFAADDDLSPGHWFWDLDQSGGIHVEHGVHFFDLCNHLAGRPPTEAWGSTQRRPDGRQDRVSATVRYGDQILATFYHSFNQIRRFEHTTIRLHCLRGQIGLEGWIPTHLTMQGLVDSHGLETLRALLGDRLQVRERFGGEAALFHHGGASEEIVAVVYARDSAPNRHLEYKLAIQAGMRDLVGAIRENRPPAVSSADALSSLAVAIAASRASCVAAAIDAF